MDRPTGHLTKSIDHIVPSLVWVKVVAMGNSTTGKTCLIKHFCESKFSAGYQATVGVDYGFKIQNVQGIDLRVHLWDLSGCSEYLDVRNELYAKSDAAFLVYDITNPASFSALDTWYREIQRYGGSNAILCVVANKIDLKTKRNVQQSEARQWAAEHKAMYAETSCQSGKGIEEMFNEILQQVVLKKQLNKAKTATDAT